MMTKHPDAQAHGNIEKWVDGIYWVQGCINMGKGMCVSRNMTIVVHNDELTLINAVRLNKAGEEELDKLGSVKNIVKIGYFHGMDDAYYLSKYSAEYWALPAGARENDPTPTQTLETDHLPFPHAQLFVFNGTKYPEAALLVKTDGGLLISCDSVQNWPDTARCSLLAKLLTRIYGFTKRPAQIGPQWLKGMTPPGGSLKGDFEKLAELSFDKLVSAHGAPLNSGAQEAFKATCKATFS
jgi:hypothetical protein